MLPALVMSSDVIVAHPKAKSNQAYGCTFLLFILISCFLYAWVWSFNLGIWLLPTKKNWANDPSYSLPPYSLLFLHLCHPFNLTVHNLHTLMHPTPPYPSPSLSPSTSRDISSLSLILLSIQIHESYSSFPSLTTIPS